MVGNAQARTSSIVLFALIALGIYAGAVAISRGIQASNLPQAVFIGLTLDLVLLVPITYFLMIVRRQILPVTSLAAILAINFAFAHYLIPSDQKSVLYALQMAMAPIELGLLAWIIRKSISSLKSVSQNKHDDPLLNMNRAAMDVMKHRLFAGILASEVAAIFYSFASFKRPSHVPDGYASFSHHEKSGLGGVTFAAMFLVLIETIVVHKWLVGWSPLVAWFLTAGSIYTVLWLYADYRATVLRPILIGPEKVVFRSGLRWTIIASATQVAEITQNDPGLGKSCQNLPLLTSPTHWVRFSSPVIALGPYGFQKEVLAVGLEPDECGPLTAAIEQLTTK